MMIRWQETSGDGSAKDDLRIALEHTEGTEWKSWPWPEGVSFPQMLSTVAEDLISAGNSPGAGGLGAAKAVTELEYLLQAGLNARYNLADNSIRGIVQIEEHSVALTDRGVVQLNRPHYVVSLSRLDEMNWYDHLSEKPWVDKENFFHCLDIAKAMVSSGKMAAQQSPG
ncbi:MAG: hypothetical protein GEV28_01690 [Actinophytocola sp.]|uniref:hypothetical protein n=1 Tax=Actinophytocola sp. TaxID=1872138 RepID=UPI00132576C8|nr:hypothetical protein [Actinophytocola sp.]MPZ79165.1 hypothetical protein [Actinophytocola sp.]